MKKTLLTAAGIAVLGLSMNACGIGALEPEPIPLNGPHLGAIALDHTAINNTLNVCGKEASDFKTTLRNGFNFIAGEKVTVTSPEQADSTLILNSLAVKCLGDKFLDGNVINFDVEYVWKFKDGSEFKQKAVVTGAGSNSKKALNNAVENLYNYTFSSYLSKLNFGSNGG